MPTIIGSKWPEVSGAVRGPDGCQRLGVHACAVESREIRETGSLARITFEYERTAAMNRDPFYGGPLVPGGWFAEGNMPHGLTPLS